MASAVPDLHPRLVETLDAFDADGITLSASEIVWLADLRKPCDRTTDGSIPWAMGSPLRYGGETFWPLHELADNWFRRAYKLLHSDGVLDIACYLFAHTRSAPGDVSLRMLTSVDEMREAVSEWYTQAAIHAGQLNVLCEAMHTLDGTDGGDVEDPDAKPALVDAKPDNGSKFAAMMCKAFPGVSPEYWLSEISKTDALAMLDAVSESGPFATSRERTEAISNYLRAVKTLWRIHSG